MAVTALRYGAPSAVTSRDGQELVTLQAADPVLLHGEVSSPRLVGLGILAVSANARARHYIPPGSADRQFSDPIVTTGTGPLRLESFSTCNGVHARLDLYGGALAVTDVRPGTTNVDVNPAMRAALARLAAGGTARLEVTRTSVALETGDSRVVERQVPLPERWVRGLAEVPWVCAALRPAAELGRVEALRFLRGLPSRTRTVWAVPAGRGLRLSASGGPGAIPVAGPDRLQTMRDLAPLATGLRIHVDPDADGRHGTVAWQLDLDGARYTLTTSPRPDRGFSGEGGVLSRIALADPSVTGMLLDHLLPGEAVDAAALVAATGAHVTLVEAGLAELAAAGRIGHDLADRSWYQRDLPFARAVLEQQHPRLLRARALLTEGRVSLDDPHGGVGGAVSVDDAVHRVDPDAATPCTCPWVARHGRDRGPCAHLLAVQLARAAAGRATVGRAALQPDEAGARGVTGHPGEAASGETRGR